MEQVRKWIRKADVMARYGATSDRQLADMMAAGLPKAHYFGPRSPRWSVDQLEEFDRRILAGEISLVDPAAATRLTQKARDKYAERVASGEVRASRQATAARKRAEGAAA